MEQAQRSGSPAVVDRPAGERYLLLADISGYTGFMTGVEQEHGVDFSGGSPAAYGELVAGPGVAFLESREVELKGIEGSHRLFAVDLT